ncbi:glycosyl-4,4'-diaponeurosporenoate acyltransferase CrtO family protein [Adhaeribacter radiodurans]|uniref:Glycosyl-4,4'-diaponeurosporenoate acyltransferase n=1 Tax=Adhaeribacter radiodurans TaxID=2745197 RepID=A0A7L7LCF6_9BACT|nr:hypothetical protein [Adhaeribacter radiodurans]QMU30427.1 hypothetical protein HUW48_21455 [Adhaeribacter radiodurans]
MIKYVRVGLVLLFVICMVVAAALWQGLPSFLFAWILNFMLMTGVLYLTQTFQPPLTSTYYHSKRWEADGKLYEWFGVLGFRKILVWIGWEKLQKTAYPVKKSLTALKHLEYSTRQSEFGHLIIFFIVSFFILFVALKEGIQHSLWLIFLNVIFHVYPIVVQRYNRPRLQKAIHRIQSLF